MNFLVVFSTNIVRLGWKKTLSEASNLFFRGWPYRLMLLSRLSDSMVEGMAFFAHCLRISGIPMRPHLRL